MLRFLFLIIFFALPTSTVAAEKILICGESRYYKMTENLFGARRAFYETNEWSSQGWTSLCSPSEDERVDGYRVTCVKIYKSEWKIDFDKPVGAARKYECDPPNPESNIKRLLRIEATADDEAARRRDFKRLNCSFFGPNEIIHALETREDDGIWKKELFPEFYPFSKTKYLDQIRRSQKENYGGSKTIYTKTIDFEIPREIRTRTEIDLASMRPIDESKPSVVSCEVYSN